MNYKEDRAELKAEQSEMDYDDIKDQMAKKSDYILELDHIQLQTHHWIDRGAKMTCENAGHPYHEAFKRRNK